MRTLALLLLLWLPPVPAGPCPPLDDGAVLWLECEEPPNQPPVASFVIIQLSK